MTAESNKTVVVTGASTGIGWACVKVLAAAGWRVFAGVRKSKDAERLTAAFGDAVRPILFDVTDPARSRPPRTRSARPSTAAPSAASSTTPGSRSRGPFSISSCKTLSASSP